MKQHGGYIYHKDTNILDFSANIHPYGMPEPVMMAMEHALRETIHYPDPDCERLKAAIAAKHGISKKRIVCGNGAADLIFRLALLLNAKKILLPVPTFVEYEEAFCTPVLSKPQIIEYPLNTDTFMIEDDILSYLNLSVDVLILCNPNNPTGTMIQYSLLMRIIEKAKRYHIFVILDECFLDFVIRGKDFSVIAQITKYPNVFILKSFTKMYAIPGVRLGYGVCSDLNFVRKMEMTAPSWNVSHIAQAAGIAACQIKDYEEMSAVKIQELRQWMLKEFSQLPVRIWEGNANYLFFQADGCVDLDKKCLMKGISIRHCDNYRGLGKDYYRVAVRKQEENEKLIQILEDCLRKKEFV